MELRRLHEWVVSVGEAQQIQRELAGTVIVHTGRLDVRLIVGTDVSGLDSEGKARAAAVSVEYPGLGVMEEAVVAAAPSFPYVPGLLSFREIPVLAGALERLKASPDLLIVDGQGLAHPRRFGLACHLGLLLDIPAIGCAKSRLCGTHGEVGQRPGDWTPLMDQGEVVGAALRTREGANPVYVSVGHRIDLPRAIEWVMKCCRGYRVPEPTRRAHLAAARATSGSGAAG